MSAPATAVSSAPAPKMRTVTPMGISLVVAVLVFLAHVPLAVVHFQKLWFNPQYQLFPIVLAGAYALLWPLPTFKLSPAGPLWLANRLMALGGVLLAVGMIGETIEGWNFGTPGSWVAAGGILMLAALPLELLGSPTQAFAGRANPKAGSVLVGICWLILLFAAFLRAPAVATFSAIAVIASIPITAGGWPLLRRCLPGLAYVILILPPPFGLDTIFVQKLQFFAARASSAVLDYIGVHHYLSGITIQIGDKTYMVEQGCSGISSLLSTLACVLFYVLWFRTSWIRGGLLTLSSIFWVLVNNVTRIVGITFFGVGFNLLGRHWSLNLATGMPHQIFGLLLFVVTLFMLWSTDRLLMFFGRSEIPKRRFDPLPSADDKLASSWRLTLTQKGNWLHSYAIAGAFGLLAALQSLDLYILFVRLPYSGSALAKLYEKVDQETMPPKVGQWVRTNFETPSREAGDPLGQFSRMWRYKNNVQEAILSLDYPYPEFHDLRVCYMVQGWKFDVTDTFDHDKQHFIRVKMHKPNQVYGTLWFCSFDQDGVAVDPALESDLQVFTEKGLTERATIRVRDRLNQWKHAFSPTELQTTGVGSILQVQELVITHTPLNANDVASAEALYKEGVSRLRQRCVELRSGK